MPGSQININHELPTDSVSITVEPPAELAARLEAQRRYRRVKEAKDLVIFALVVFGIVATTCVAIYEMIFDHAATEETRHWAQTYLIAMATGLITYAFGHRMGEAER